MTQLASSLSQEAKQRLEVLIAEELKSAGLTVQLPPPTKHRSKRLAHKNAAGKIFGRALDVQDLEHVDGYGPVPGFLVSVRALLEKYRDVEGIFRKAGSAARVKSVRAAVEQGGAIPANTQAHDLADMVKQYFRELPEPLFTTQYSETFLAVAREESNAMRTSCLHLLCLLLPSVHLSTLTFFMSLLADFAEHCQSNKMESHNLALCVSPNLFNLDEDGELLCNKNKLRTQVIQDLIGIAREIGFVPQRFEERLSECSERLGEKITTPDRGKKRRRGSLDGMKKAVRRSLDSLGLIFRAGHSRRNSETGTPLPQLGHADAEQLSSTGELTVGDHSHLHGAAKRPGSLDRNGRELGASPVIKKRKLQAEDDQRSHVSQEDPRLTATDEVKSSGSVSSRLFKNFGVFSRKRSPSPAASTERRQELRYRTGSRGDASPVSACKVPDQHVNRRLASDSRESLVLTCPALRLDSAETMADQQASSSAVGSVALRMDNQAVSMSTPLRPGRWLAALQQQQSVLLDAAATSQPLDGAAGDDPSGVPHPVRAQAPTGRCMTQLLPSRMRPATPTGSGRLKAIDKAQISAPILLPSAGDNEVQLSESVTGSGCRLLALTEAAAAGVGKPRLSPPESPALFERVRSFRRQNNRTSSDGQALREPIGASSCRNARPSSSCSISASTCSDSICSSSSSASVSGTAPSLFRGDWQLPDRPTSEAFSKELSKCDGNAEGDSTGRPAESGWLTMPCQSQVGIPQLTDEDESRCCESRSIEHGNSGGHTNSNDSDPTGDHPSLPATLTGDAIRSLIFPATASCPACFAGDEAEESKEIISRERSDCPSDLLMHSYSSLLSRKGSVQLSPARMLAVSLPDRQVLRNDLPDSSSSSSLLTPQNGQPSSFAVQNASTPGRAESSDLLAVANSVAPSTQANGGDQPGVSERQHQCPLSTSEKTTTAAEEGPAARVTPAGRLQVSGSSSEQRPAAGQRQSLLYLRDAGLVRRCLRGQGDWPQTATGRLVDNSNPGVAIDSRTSCESKARVPPYRQPVESAIRRLPQRVPPSMVFSSDIGNRRHCVKVVEGILQGHHDDIVCRRADDSLPASSNRVIAKEIGRTEKNYGNGPVLSLEAKASLLRPPLRENNAELPSCVIPAKPAAAHQGPRIKEPILPIDLMSSRTRMSFSSDRQVKRLTNNSPRSPGLGRIASAAPVSCLAPRPGGSPLRPIPCRLSVKEPPLDGQELDTLV